MRAVIQRVSQASVTVDGVVCGQIGKGLVILLGVARDDELKDVEYLAEKCMHLRVFADEQDKMNRSLLDINGSALVISQFTLFADTHRGRRPSFIAAAEPEKGQKLYRRFVDYLKQKQIPVQTGVFGAMMDVTLTNDGPVTIILDSAEGPHRRN